MALVALAAGEIVGVARYAPSDAGDLSDVESAIVVSDAWQGAGVGRQLLDALLALADGAGVRTIRASTLVDNRTVARMLEHRGFREVSVDHGVIDWQRQIPLPSATKVALSGPP